MKRKCEICGTEYEAKHRDLGYSLLPVYDDCRTSIKIVKERRTIVRMFDTCEDCATKIIDYIESIKRR